jgi:hypothetical protein
VRGSFPYPTLTARSRLSQRTASAKYRRIEKDTLQVPDILTLSEIADALDTLADIIRRLAGDELRKGTGLADTHQDPKGQVR